MKLFKDRISLLWGVQGRDIRDSDEDGWDLCWLLPCAPLNEPFWSTEAFLPCVPWISFWSCNLSGESSIPVGNFLSSGGEYSREYFLLIEWGRNPFLLPLSKAPSILCILWKVCWNMLSCFHLSYCLLMMLIVDAYQMCPAYSIQSNIN